MTGAKVHLEMAKINLEMAKLDLQQKQDSEGVFEEKVTEEHDETNEGNDDANQVDLDQE